MQKIKTQHTKFNSMLTQKKQIGLPTLNIVKPNSTFELYQNTNLIVNSKNVGNYLVVNMEENENYSCWRYGN